MRVRRRSIYALFCTEVLQQLITTPALQRIRRRWNPTRLVWIFLVKEPVCLVGNFFSTHIWHFSFDIRFSVSHSIMNYHGSRRSQRFPGDLWWISTFFCSSDVDLVTFSEPDNKEFIKGVAVTFPFSVTIQNLADQSISGVRGKSVKKSCGHTI